MIAQKRRYSSYSSVDVKRLLKKLKKSFANANPKDDSCTQTLLDGTRHVPGDFPRPEISKDLTIEDAASEAAEPSSSDFFFLDKENMKPKKNVISRPVSYSVDTDMDTIEKDNASTICNDERDDCDISKSRGAAVSTEQKEEEIKPTPEHIENESNSSGISAADDDHAAMKRSQRPVNRASCTDFFTPELLKAHISSLRNIKDPDAMEDVLKDLHDDDVDDEGENFCQLCTLSEKLYFAPEAVYCSSCNVRIKPRRNYYCTPEDCAVPRTFCPPCYRQCHGKVTIDGCSTSKAQMVKKQNSLGNDEPWVQCDRCQRWQHQICALFNSKMDLNGESEYICPLCCLGDIQGGGRVSLPASPPFSAADLPKTKLSDHIENRLLRRLKGEREEMAKSEGLNVEQVPAAKDLTVRVILSVKRKLKVKPDLLNIFGDKKYPGEFPYTSKKIDGVDVCLYGMYVQEFGSECGPPNRRSVYISYLDSAKYFEPRRRTVSGEPLRSFVYHEILLGYLEECRNRGFSTCYIWSCPPSTGEDYIFHCHPEMQRTPNRDRLRQWYRAALRKAEKERIVLSHTNFYDRFFAPKGDEVSASGLPYFDGGYWSTAAEDFLRSIENDTWKELKRKVEKLFPRRRPVARNRTRDAANGMRESLMMQKLGQAISPFKDDFIIVELRRACAGCGEVFSGGRTLLCCTSCEKFCLCLKCHRDGAGRRGKKPSNLWYCDNGGGDHSLLEADRTDAAGDGGVLDDAADISNACVENRLAFLELCQENNYQFDTVRRAKYSSMMILYHLHRSIDDGSAGPATAPPPSVDCSAPRALPVRDVLEVLVHCSGCRAAGSGRCTNPWCRPMKRLFGHARRCCVRASGGCLFCSRVWWLLRAHSSLCKNSVCDVPRCLDLREKREKAEIPDGGERDR